MMSTTDFFPRRGMRDPAPNSSSGNEGIQPRLASEPGCGHPGRSFLCHLAGLAVFSPGKPKTWLALGLGADNCYLVKDLGRLQPVG